jgi:hypothetical protein
MCLATMACVQRVSRPLTAMLGSALAVVVLTFVFATPPAGDRTAPGLHGPIHGLSVGEVVPVPFEVLGQVVRSFADPRTHDAPRSRGRGPVRSAPPRPRRRHRCIERSAWSPVDHAVANGSGVVVASVLGGDQLASEPRDLKAGHRVARLADSFHWSVLSSFPPLGERVHRSSSQNGSSRSNASHRQVRTQASRARGHRYQLTKSGHDLFMACENLGERGVRRLEPPPRTSTRTGTPAACSRLSSPSRVCDSSGAGLRSSPSRLARRPEQRLCVMTRTLMTVLPPPSNATAVRRYR